MPPLTARRRLLMRAIGILCGLAGIGAYQLYKHHRRESSVCAGVFTEAEVKTWTPQVITEHRGFSKDDGCGFYWSTPRRSELDLGHRVVGVEIKGIKFWDAADRAPANQLRSLPNLERGVRYAYDGNTELLVDLEPGILRVILGPELDEARIEQVIARLPGRLDAPRAFLADSMKRYLERKLGRR